MYLINKYKSLDFESKKTFNSIIAVGFGIAWSVIKMIIGIVDFSKFLIASSIFTMCLASSKLLCVIGIRRHEKEYIKFIHMTSSLMIFLCGLFYGIYNTRLLEGELTTNYGLIPSIAIAVVSFFLFVKAIVFLFKDRKKDDYNRNLRVISFVSGFMDIVLTQMCLLAVKSPEKDPKYNLYIALGVSTLTAILGIYCFLKPILNNEQNK